MVELVNAQSLSIISLSSSSFIPFKLILNIKIVFSSCCVLNQNTILSLESDNSYRMYLVELDVGWDTDGWLQHCNAFLNS